MNIVNDELNDQKVVNRLTYRKTILYLRFAYAAYLTKLCTLNLKLVCCFYETNVCGVK